MLKLEWPTDTTTNISIKDGRIIRPSIYREAETSKQYAEEVKNGPVDDICIFCTSAIQKSALEARDNFYTIKARPSYTHFDAQRVMGHELLIPYRHVNTLRRLGLAARQEIESYLWDKEDELRDRKDVRFQDYLRNPSSPSKSIDHLHIHLLKLGLDPVNRLSYDITNGLTELEFGTLSPEQIDEINHTRQD